MQIQGETFINKLIVLFVFDKMESSLSERTIIDMCSTSNDWINYMDCMMIIAQLLEDGFICTVETNDDTLYTITPDGRSCLANFYINIPKSTREEISVFVKNNSARYRNRQECKSDYYQEGRHLHRVPAHPRPRPAHARAQIRRARPQDGAEYL